jgi:hypothetical protein
MYIYIYCIWCRFKRKTEVQVIFLNPFTIFSSSKRKFVVCPLLYEEINGTYQFVNGLNGLETKRTERTCPSVGRITETFISTGIDHGLLQEYITVHSFFLCFTLSHLADVESISMIWMLLSCRSSAKIEMRLDDIG